MSSGIASLYVINGKTGAVIFQKNEQTGLAPASTQKVITGASAYELLGKDFRYKTGFGYKGEIRSGVLHGDLYINPSGDPTLGSWRWKATKEEEVMKRLVTALKKAGIRNYHDITVNNAGWEAETIPDGWIWQDVGNYYGAGATAAPKGSGDNAYVYYPLSTRDPIVRGTIPVGEKRFVISAAYPDAEMEFLHLLSEQLKGAGIHSQAFDSISTGG